MKRIQGQALLEKMGIDEAEIESRKRLMGVRPEDADILVKARSFIEPVIPDMVQEFLEILSERNEIARFSLKSDALESLTEKLESYLLGFFQGDYGNDYVYERLRIGQVHQHRAVEPKHYIAAMKSLQGILRRHVSKLIPDKNFGLAVWDALDTLLNLDFLFVLDTYLLSLVSEIDQAKNELEDYAHSLEEKVADRTRELEELSRRDSLTGLYNHRAFTEFLRRDLALAIRNSSPLCLVYIDVDDFKLVNDRHGHHEGDQVLKHFGWVLAAVSRESDIPCRYGGDEFCVILPNVLEAQARIYCERVMTEFAKEHGGVTASFGIVQSGPDDHTDMDTLIRRADELMYSAKRTDDSSIFSRRQ